MGCTKWKLEKTRKALNSILTDKLRIFTDDEIKRLQLEVDELEYQEEVHRQQRSRNSWLEAGDKIRHTFATEPRRENVSLLSPIFRTLMDIGVRNLLKLETSSQIIINSYLQL